MFHLSLEYLMIGETKLRTLNDEAEDRISTRGYSDAAEVPPELSNPDSFFGS